MRLPSRSTCVAKQLRPFVQQLFLPLSHLLRVNVLLFSNLCELLLATDRLQGHLELQFLAAPNNYQRLEK
jgi:hypothetical protein